MQHHKESFILIGRKVILLILTLPQLTKWVKMPHSETKRAQIITFYTEKYTKCQISMKLKCSKTAVHTAIMNYGMYSEKMRCGMPRKTSPRDDHLIRRIATRSPTSSCSKIRGDCFIKVHTLVLWEFLVDWDLNVDWNHTNQPESLD